MSDAEARAAFVAVLEPLALGLRVAIDAPTWVAYYRALQDVPLPLLQAAADAAQLDPTRRFFPTVPELCALILHCRNALLAVHPYQPGECCHRSGWQAIDMDGVSRLRRCACWRQWQAELATLDPRAGSLAPRGPSPQLTLPEPVAPELVQQLIAKVAAMVCAKTMPTAAPQTDPDGAPLP